MSKECVLLLTLTGGATDQPACRQAQQQQTCEAFLLIAQQPSISLLCYPALPWEIGSWSAVRALSVSPAR